jgi:hypothetical protein
VLFPDKILHVQGTWALKKLGNGDKVTDVEAGGAGDIEASQYKMLPGREFDQDIASFIESAIIGAIACKPVEFIPTL